jgi:hypothetical protein
MVMDCPHCSAENSTFLFQHVYQVKKGDRPSIFWMLFQCPRCSAGVVVKASMKKQQIPFDAYKGDIRDLFHSVEHFPRRPFVDAPSGLPTDVQRLYLRAAQCFQRDDMDSASMMFRKTLEVALKEKFGDFPGNLYQHIQHLAQAHLLTDDLAQWAHEIRIDGNRGAHEAQEPDWEDTRQLKEFLHVFLLYTFSLPALVEARRKKS